MRLPAFYQAILVIVAAYLVFDNAFPPVLPKTLMIQYMIITVVGVLLYYSFDDERWAEFLAPAQAVLRDDNKTLLRAFFLLAIPRLFLSTAPEKQICEAPHRVLPRRVSMSLSRSDKT